MRTMRDMTFAIFGMTSLFVQLKTESSLLIGAVFVFMGWMLLCFLFEFIDMNSRERNK